MKPAPKDIFATFYQKMDTFYVHLNPKENNVVLPEHLMDKDFVTLELGTGLAVPVTDLSLTEEGFVAGLSFNRSPFTVFVPWNAVYSMSYSNGSGIMGINFKPMPSELFDNKPQERDTVEKDKATGQESKPAKVVSLADYKKRKGLV